MMVNLLQKLSWKENKRRFLNIRGIASGDYAFKGPDVVQIDLTDKCDSACEVCWVHSPLIKNQALNGQDLDLAAAKKFIREVADCGTKEIIFSGGGEPFFYPGIWEALECAEENNVNFRINTNFTLLDSAGIKKLLAFRRLVSLTVSVWAGESALYCRMHNRAEQGFRQLKDNLKILNVLRGRQLEVRLFSLVNNVNYRALEGILDFAIETKTPGVEFGVMDVLPSVTEKYLLNIEELQYLRRDFLRLAKTKKGARIINGDLFLRRISNPAAVKGEYDTLIGERPCCTGWIFLRLRSNGDFNSCLKSHRRPLGNLHQEGFNEVWNGSKQRCFRQKGLALPRDWDYFRWMGNFDDTQGCRRLCDNNLLNTRVYCLSRFLHWPKNDKTEKTVIR